MGPQLFCTALLTASYMLATINASRGIGRDSVSASRGALLIYLTSRFLIIFCPWVPGFLTGSDLKSLTLPLQTGSRAGKFPLAHCHIPLIDYSPTCPTRQVLVSLYRADVLCGGLWSGRFSPELRIPTQQPRDREDPRNCGACDPDPQYCRLLRDINSVLVSVQEDKDPAPHRPEAVTRHRYQYGADFYPFRRSSDRRLHGGIQVKL